MIHIYKFAKQNARANIEHIVFFIFIIFFCFCNVHILSILILQSSLFCGEFLIDKFCAVIFSSYTHENDKKKIEIL